MKKCLKAIILLSSALTIFMTTAPINAQIRYIESDDTQESETNHDDTIDSINEAEGLSAEQIIMQITADGFVTSHGDHYHYYNGNVPFDGIFSEKLLAPEFYVFDEKDSVNKIENGHVVLKDGKYFIYFGDLTDVTSLRTEEEMVLQGYLIHPSDAKKIVELKNKLNLSDDTAIRYQLEKTEAEYNENNDDSVIVYLFNQGYVTLINDALIVFPKAVPTESLFDESLLVDDNYELNKEDIVSDVNGGHIVQVDQKFYLYLTDVSSTENLISIQ